MIELELAEPRQALVRSWQWHREHAQSDAKSAEAEMERAKNQFAKRVEEINKAIRNYNLEIPVAALFKAPVFVSAEFLRLLV